MLKDLDQRQTDKTSESINDAVPMANNQSPKKVIFVSLITIIILNIIGLVFWQLYSENQSLKSIRNDNVTPVLPTEMKNAETKKTEIKKNTITTLVHPLVNVNQSAVNSSVPKAVTTVQKALLQSNQDVEDENNITTANTNGSSLTKSLPKNNKSSDKESQALTNNVKLDGGDEIKSTVSSPPSSLTISRRKMSPQDLAKQKFARAKQAVTDKEVIQAERLFEEILLLLPNHKPARKQLAALWFGRQSYQAALNLLSQGVALAPQDSEYRLMQARIYLSQGQGGRALQTLIVLADSTNVEYQALLANTAQQQGQFLDAISAYQQLTNLQVNKGRWWLGLAIAFDSDGQFLKAEQAYKTAITQQNLSNNSADFARKRIIELGE
jgi:MSHA biogenesis protein MshN